MRPIGNVCYDQKDRSHTAIGIFLLVVGHRTIGRTRGRAVSTGWRRLMARSIISLEIVRLVLVINDRLYDQSWPPTIDRTINRGILRPIAYNVSEQSISVTTGRKVARPVLNMTIDLVATDLPLAITPTTYATSRTFFLRLAHDSNMFRLQAGRNLVVSLV